MHYKLCVMGNPIEQSKSPWIHDEFAKQLNLNISYTKKKPDIDKFLQEVEQFRNDQGSGFNITLPFKEQAYQICNKLSERARIAKAVNTIICEPKGKFYGDNTDGIGLVNDITNNLNYSISEKNILIFGAGGAVRGIIHPLLCQKPKLVIIANRTMEKAKKLVQEFSAYGDIIALDFHSLNNIKIDIVIDGTGFNSEFYIPTTLILSKNSLFYDLKYGNIKTPFIDWAKTKKTGIFSDGLGMLVEQAAEAFYLWTNKKPESKIVLELARKTFFPKKEI